MDEVEWGSLLQGISFLPWPFATLCDRDLRSRRIVVAVALADLAPRHIWVGSAPSVRCCPPVDLCVVGGLLCAVLCSAALACGAWACHKILNSQGRDPRSLEIQEGFAPP